MTVDKVRSLALAFPEAIEQPHFGNPSFRVRDRIFATVPDNRHLNVMIDPYDVEAAIRAAPATCVELLWGKEVRGRPGCTRRCRARRGRRFTRSGVAAKGSQATVVLSSGAVSIGQVGAEPFEA